LDSYGYTFVGKGTVVAFQAKLKHEGLVYRHLNEIQGELIPVYLGNISLTSAYFLDFKVRIVHMLLMSWGGEQVESGSTGWEVDAETIRKKLLHYGVEHHDVRPPNVLRSSGDGKVMLVDFERSEILKRAPALQELSPNKRRRIHSNEGVSCSRLSADLSLTISYYSQKAYSI
jgi:hypothetical protein